MKSAKKECIVIDLLQIAKNFDCYFGSCIPPSPAGMYADAVPYAIFLDSEKYYDEAGVVVTPMASIDTVYDKSGEVVAPAHFMQRRFKLLKPEPIVNPNAVKIVQLYIHRYFENRCPFIVTRDAHRAFVEALLPEYQHIALPKGAKETNISQIGRFYNWSHATQLDEWFDFLAIQLSAFVGEDIWSVYDIVSKGYAFQIIKEDDFRILDWMEKFGETYRNLYHRPHTGDTIDTAPRIHEQPI